MISEFPHFLDTMIPNFHIFFKVFCMTWSHRPWSSGRAPNLCHRRIQGAGVLSVIERSGGLFGQVLKMEETPKWHKMTIVNPKKNRNTFFTNLHYLCWDLPFLFFLGDDRCGCQVIPMTWLLCRVLSGKIEKPWENRELGGTQNGADLIQRRSGPNSCWLLKEGSKHAGGFHYFHVAGSRCTSDVIRICFDDLFDAKSAQFEYVGAAIPVPLSGYQKQSVTCSCTTHTTWDIPYGMELYG